MRVKVGAVCFKHGERHDVEIPKESIPAYRQWERRELYVQDIPGLSADVRETLLTGTCQEAWDDNFADEECEYDCDGSSHPGKMCK